jgi:uncharacterized protein (DUF1697 family)
MKYVAFLRAINVGGRTVTMSRLREVFENEGFQKVATFIASGNVLFETRATNAAALERRIEGALLSSLGFEVDTMIRTITQVAAAAALDPFGSRQGAKSGDEEGDPITDYVAFLKEAPGHAAAARLMGQATDADALHLAGSELYWRRLDRAKSRFSGAALERALGMPATVRNINTVQKLAAL